MQLATRSPTYEKLRIIKNGIIYTLPANWALTDTGSATIRNNLEDRAFTHGSACIGDGKISGRTITVEFDMQGATESEHDEAVNLAYQYFYQNDYEIIAGRSDRKYKVAGISKIKHKFEKGFKQRWSNVTVSLLLADPFRYAVNSTNLTWTFASAQSETLLTVTNPSSVDVPLIWSFKPSVTMASITVLHLQTAESFVLTDALLTTPAAGVINAETGTVLRDTSNAINAFSGLFLRALAGTNKYAITCDAGQVSINFTPRWFA